MTTPPPTERNSIWKVLIPVLVIAALAVGALYVVRAVVGRNGPQGAQGTHVELEEGALVPDFTLKRLDKTEVKFSEVKARVVLLNFWATWCDACVQEIPSIGALRKAYFEKGFEVLAVNMDENPEAVLPAFVKKFNMEFPVFVDLEGAIGQLFGVQGIPLTLLIGMKDRKILMVESGERDWNSEEMHSRLDGWLKQ